MLEKDLTFQKFGYFPEKLKSGSHKQVVVICDYCGIETYPVYKNYNNGIKNSIVKKDCCVPCRGAKTKEGYELRGDKEEKMNQAKESRKQTCLEKFGTEFAIQNPKSKRKCTETWKNKSKEEIQEINEKRRISFEENHGCDRANYQRDKNIDKWGVSHIPYTEEIGEKRRESCLENLGTEYPGQSQEVQEKSKKTMREKYGVDYYFQTEELKEITRNEKPANTIKANAKRIETNLEKYGTENPQQNLEVRGKTKKTNIRNGKIIIYEGKTINEWAKEKDVSRGYVIYTIEQLGLEGFKNSEKKITNIESIIRNMLLETGIDFIQHPVINKRKRGDFLVRDIVIEADGNYWHSEANYKFKDKYYHQKKREFYSANNLKSLFFYYDDIISKQNIVRNIIFRKLNIIQNKIYDDNYQVFIIPKNQSENFLKENDICGFSNKFLETISYGIFNQDILIHVVQINIDIYNSVEILRNCSKIDFNIADSLQKILEKIKLDFPDAKKVIIDHNLRYGNFNLENLNFIKINEYLSFKWTDTQFSFPSESFPNDSGYDNGMYKIWGCGNEIWELNL